MNAAELEQLADELGIDVVGAATAEPYEETERHIRDRRARGLFADMRFTMAQPEISCHPEQLLCDPLQWARIHYPTLADRRLRGKGTLTITRDGVSHGLLVWFDTELIERIGYSNAPGTQQIYGQMLFPWSQSVPLQAGDTVSFDIRVDPFGTSSIWTWTSEVRLRSAPDHVAQRMRHSTFQTFSLSGAVHTRASAFIPSLSHTGVLTSCVLEGLRARRSIGELASDLFSRNGGRFRSLDEAQGFVTEVVDLFGA